MTTKINDEGMVPMRCTSISEKMMTGGKVWVYTFVPDMHQGHLKRSEAEEDLRRNGHPPEEVGAAMVPMERHWRIATTRKLDDVELNGLYAPKFVQVGEVAEPPLGVRDILQDLFGDRAMVVDLGSLKGMFQEREEAKTE